MRILQVVGKTFDFIWILIPNQNIKGKVKKDFHCQSSKLTFHRKKSLAWKQNAVTVQNILRVKLKLEYKF